ncbi:olfactory receptor 52N2-like [Bufo gargarizans]|uniref:olfactory receptor 52N2-like n=1 Tax=Bufo gargarizans TaxID=30331 RepID=UPI001CF18CEE|nr:olfactory receptor 52N2-like [Bufo gargarizans]
MASVNISNIYSNVFILQGIPGLESYHVWIAILLFVMYVLAILGNPLMLLLILMEPQLHNPMYYFLSTLFLTDIILSNSIVHKMFCIFWLNDKEITFVSCFIQMFFIHCFSSIESGILLAMAFDRYMAICNPLHYRSALTNTLIVKIVVALVIRSTVIVIPCSWMASRLPYCQSHHIPHSYCDHMAVVKLACTDITINSVYGLTVVLIIIVFDISCIAVSYVLILRAVLRLSTKNAKKKAFGTCTSHITIIVMLYTLGLFSILTYRVGHITPYLHVTISNLYLLIPPTLNPIIYGVRTQEIRTAALHFFTHIA